MVLSLCATISTVRSLRRSASEACVQGGREGAAGQGVGVGGKASGGSRATGRRRGSLPTSPLKQTR